MYYNCNGDAVMINNEIQAITDRLQSTLTPKRIYLFGSFANGTYTDESDYDFYLVVSDHAGDKISLSQTAYKALRGLRKRPVDIVIGYETPFARRAKAETDTLERVVSREGILLYAEQ